ncbi:MAG TPA: di-heme oxidoredictase family protein [Bryobacteraceae bacterium]|nr:di-heme oxidoredictase family protein [Bryobacteraceae bacterium]
MRRFAVLLGAAALLFAQSTGRPVLPGDPLPNITAGDFERFRIGLEDFTEVETAEDGLGPAFNGTSCAVCHSVPAIGGISSMTEIRAGHRGEGGTFTELNGGTLYHLFSIPNHLCQVQIPAEANVIARRQPIPLFGAGLIEAIPDEAIAALEDSDDRDGDGISGRAARIVDVANRRERIGRFGWKAQHATLLAFSGDAYRNEMGITNELFPDEVALGVNEESMRLCSPRRGLEDVRERQTGLRGIDNFESFMKFLAPIARGPIDGRVRSGEQLFQSIGCASCHTPTMTTAPNANPLFDRKEVPLFSDLLLHDVGTGDGIPQEAAAEDEIRTPALWGLRLRRPFLHDGSAATPDEAIRRHGGEAASVVKKYLDASPDERETLLAFLRSL